jgi:hypothetical protein
MNKHSNNCCRRCRKKQSGGRNFATQALLALQIVLTMARFLIQ